MDGVVSWQSSLNWSRTWGHEEVPHKACVSRSSDLNCLCKAWSCACTNSVAFGSGGIKVCGFDLMFLFGEAWEVGEQRSDDLHVAAMSQPWCL